MDDELAGRPRSVQVRLGYLLSGVRPDLVERIRDLAGQRVPFGAAGPVRRVDEAWQVVDTLLPLSPALLEPVDPATP